MGEYSSCIIGDTAGVMGGDLSFVRKETHLCRGRKPVLSHQKKLFLYNWRRHSLEEIHSVSLEETPVLWEETVSCIMRENSFLSWEETLPVSWDQGDCVMEVDSSCIMRGDSSCTIRGD